MRWAELQIGDLLEEEQDEMAGKFKHMTLTVDIQWDAPAGDQFMALPALVWVI